MARNKWFWITGTAMGVLLLAMWFILSGFAATGSGDSPSPEDADESQAQAQLFVDPAQVATDYCADLVQKYDLDQVEIESGTHMGTQTPVFVVGASENVPPRLWSRGPNVPLAPLTLEAEQAVICHDPAQAAMVMNRLGQVRIGTKTIAEVNSAWIGAQGPANDDGEIPAIKSWAASCMTTNVDTHLACAKTMSYTAVLLARFQALPGVRQMPDTLWNVFLPNGAEVGEIPEFGLDPVQEKNGHWVVIEFTSKNRAVCLRFGFNVGTASSGVNGGDQRLAQFPCDEPAPTPTAQPSSTPSSTHPSSPPSRHPTPKPSPTPSRTTCTTCVTPEQATQPVPAPATQPSEVPKEEPSAQPTVPANTQSPADPTPGGYNGGSTVQPGQSGTPDPGPSQSDVAGDSGGFE